METTRINSLFSQVCVFELWQFVGNVEHLLEHTIWYLRFEKMLCNSPTGVLTADTITTSFISKRYGREVIEAFCRKAEKSVRNNLRRRKLDLPLQNFNRRQPVSKILQQVDVNKAHVIHRFLRKDIIHDWCHFVRTGTVDRIRRTE